MGNPVTQVIVVKLKAFDIPRYWLEHGTVSCVELGTLIAQSEERESDSARSRYCELLPDGEPLRMYCPDGISAWMSNQTARLIAGENRIIGMFDPNDLLAFWAGAYLFGRDTTQCPEKYRPRIAKDVYIRLAANCRQRLDDCPVWTLPIAEMAGSFGIVVRAIAAGTMENCTLAAYTLLEQTRGRVERQIQTQLGQGEAGRRIGSTFSFLHPR